MATLILSDGTTFTGDSFGASFDSAQDDKGVGQDDTFGSGEVVFNTGMVGYPESLTDPSYRGQILTFTYPLIGNYGVPSEEKNEYGFAKNLESEEIHVRGVIVGQLSEEFSHHKGVSSLHNWLEHHGIPGITGIDTRALTKKLREHGVMLGRIVQDDSELKMENEKLNIEDPNLRNLVEEVSCKEVVTYLPSVALGKDGETKDTEVRATVACFDCGIKNNILRSFLKRGVRVHRLPWNFNLAGSDLQYDALFISNGPGDPKTCKETIEQIKIAIDKQIPTFGICLGNQLLALAIGGDTYKMKYGHRGVNQPCIEIGEDGEPTSKCIITSQNHGFAVDEKKLPEGWSAWFKNANDGTNEGIKHKSGKFFSVQFHPESTPGPEDANYLFDEFLTVIKK